jgi:hypothetical protein
MPPSTRVPDIHGGVDGGTAHGAAFFESLLLLLGIPLALQAASTRFSSRADAATEQRDGDDEQHTATGEQRDIDAEHDLECV